MSLPTVTPDILSPAVSWFEGGTNYPSGDYPIYYVNGAMSLNNPINHYVCTNYHVTDGNGNIVDLPSCVELATQANVEAAMSGQHLTYHHNGGPIGIYFSDTFYTDNRSGSPNPTWNLHYVGVRLTATPSSFGCGESVVLSWNTTAADILTIDNGIGLVSVPSGSITVNPVKDITYTITGTTSEVNGTASATATWGSPSITPDVTTGAISYFSAGVSFNTGNYKIVYEKGMFRYSGLSGSTVNRPDMNPVSPAVAYKIVGDKGVVIDGPGNYDSYLSQAAGETANGSEYVIYQHFGGKIGMYLADVNYADNAAGSPSPTFRLCGPGPYGRLTTSATGIVAGTSVVLSWAITNSSTVSIDQGIGAVSASGTFSVSPTATTTYTLTASGKEIPYTTYVKIDVNIPEPPRNVMCVGQCSGNVVISWNTTQFANSYIVERAASLGGVYSQIGTPGSPGYMDTPPSAGVTYYYRVKSTDGINISAPSAIASGASLTPPTAGPANITASPGNGYVMLAWEVAAGAVSYNILDGSGASIASGVTTLNFRHAGLANGTLYQYRVQGVNGCGVGPVSSTVGATPDCSFVVNDAPVTVYT